MQPVLSEDACKRIGECCSEIGKGLLSIGNDLLSIGNDLAKAVEATAEMFRELAGAIADVLPDLIEAVKAMAADNLKEKTKPPKKPVRRLGCRPQTMICHRREFRVQRR